MRKLAFLIIVISAIIMFWQIHRYPIHLGIFEGACGLSALQVIEGDQTRIELLWDRSGRGQRTYTGLSLWSDRNPFLIYPTAFFIKLFGVDRYYITLRAAAIIYGILSVWLTYLVIGKMFNRQMGLIAAFILATSSWFIAFSRICHDFSVTIFYSLICIYIYSLSDRPRNPLGYILLGAILGLADYFYFPSRVILPVILFAILIRVITERGYFKTYRLHLVLMGIVYLLTLHFRGLSLAQLSSMGRANCEWFWVRYSYPPHRCSTPWAYLLQMLNFAYKRFFVDWGWHWDPVCERDACLGPVTRYVLIAGVIWALAKIKDHKHRFLLIWFVATAVPTLVTQVWFRRSLLVLPAIAALASLAIYNTLFFLTSWIKKGRNVVRFILIVIVLFPIAWLNLDHYFGLYGNERIEYVREHLKDRELREKFIEMLKKYKVYTNFKPVAAGYREGVKFDAKRLKREGYYMLNKEEKIRKAFNSDPGPCALLLKSGELKIKEGKEAE